MAKVGISISTQVQRRIEERTFRRIDQKGLVSARLQARINRRFEVGARLSRVRLQEIHEAWRDLQVWKKTRWSLCAMTHPAPRAPGPNEKYQNGWSLYYQCFMRQHTIIPHEPISPCSRRMTDPGASPWDYTP